MSQGNTPPITYLRRPWSRWSDFSWKIGLVLLLIVCVPRFLLVLQANTTGNYGLIGIVMVVSAIIPFVLLNKNGLREIGWRRPASGSWLFASFFIGLAFSLLLYFVGDWLYAGTSDNWYVYIARSYKIPPGISADDKLIFFIIVAATGMTFSPVGEELFFRGVVHSAFARSVGHRKASLVDASAFALVHLSHFGLFSLTGNGISCHCRH